jgi:hypothetical protein
MTAPPKSPKQLARFWRDKYSKNRVKKARFQKDRSTPEVMRVGAILARSCSESQDGQRFLKGQMGGNPNRGSQLRCYEWSAVPMTATNLARSWRDHKR